MDIILIRHGESEDNVSKVFSRDTTRLSQNGIEQIKKTKEILKNFDYSKVYYSPLTRTQETLKYLGLEGIAEKRIQEFNFGIFTGKTHSEYSKEYPEESKMWIDDVYNYQIPQGESMIMVYNRLKEFIKEIIEKDEDVVLVTHDGIVKLICCWVFDNPEYFFKFKVDNGSITVVTIEDDYKYIKSLNLKPY